MSGPWFKFYPASWVSGVRGLTLTQKGLFIELISLMYDRDGPLTDSDEELAKQIGARLSTFQAALDRLIDRGLITRDERGLMSRRAAKEINLRAQKCTKAANSAAKRWGKDEKKQQPSDANALRTHCEGIAKAMLLDDRSKKLEEKQKPSVSSKRGTRLPEGWKPSERNLSDASGMGMSSEAISTEADKFRDYWIAKPGAGGVKLDWDATWRNWCRNASSRKSSSQDGQRFDRWAGVGDPNRDPFADEVPPSSDPFEGLDLGNVVSFGGRS